MKRGFRSGGSAAEAGSPKSIWSLQSDKNSSEFAMSLGHPVPCEQGAADRYPFGSSADPFFQKPGFSDLRGSVKRQK